MKDAGYDDDDFEDYQDDFEETPEEKREPTPVNSTRINDRNDDKMLPIDRKLALFPKQKFTETNNVIFESYGSAGISTTTCSISGNLKLNSRVRRIRRLMKYQVLFLEEEKFNQLNVFPSTLSDIYYRQLKFTPNPNSNHSISTEPLIRQVGTSTRQETRDVEMNTDEIIMHDKEMQFSYGNDDTELSNLISKIKTSKEKIYSSDRKLKKKTTTQIDSMSTDVNKDNSQLESFLQMASSFIEAFFEEQRIQKVQNNKSKQLDTTNSDIKNALIDTHFDPIKCGNSPKGSIVLELIASRRVASIKCHPRRANLVITSYLYPLTDDLIEKDLKPFRGIHLIWDMYNPDTPLHVLESAGQPADCCFSGYSSQSELVVVGTLEGIVCLWDLGEADALHRDKDSLDLGIARGIRKPSYSTVMSSQLSLDNNALMTEDETAASSQHLTPISQISCLGSNLGDTANSKTSNASFVSIDITGIIIFWEVRNVMSQSTDRGRDLGLSPWSTKQLVATRIFSTTMPILPFQNPTKSKTTKTPVAIKGESLKNSCNLDTKVPGIRTTSVVGVVSDVPHLIYASSTKGQVIRFDKYNLRSVHILKPRKDSGNANVTYIAARENISPSASTSYQNNFKFDSKENLSINKSSSNKDTESNEGSNKHSSINLQTEKAIDNTSSIISTFAKSDVSTQAGATVFEDFRFVLVGRDDGSIDLFGDLDTGSFVLHTWQTSLYCGSHNYKSNSDLESDTSASFKQSAISLLKWCPDRPAAFYALNNSNVLLYFDLLSEQFAPVNVESSPSVSVSKDDNQKQFASCCDISYSLSGLRKVDMYITNPWRLKPEITTVQSHKLVSSPARLASPSRTRLNNEAAESNWKSSLGQLSGDSIIYEDLEFRYSLSTWVRLDSD